MRIVTLWSVCAVQTAAQSTIQWMFYFLQKLQHPKNFRVPEEHVYPVASERTEKSLHYNRLMSFFDFATYGEDNHVEFYSEGIIAKTAGINLDGMTVKEATYKLKQFLLQHEIKTVCAEDA